MALYCGNWVMGKRSGVMGLDWHVDYHVSHLGRTSAQRNSPARPIRVACVLRALFAIEEGFIA